MPRHFEIPESNDRCDAYRELDEMTCPSCRLRWHLDDPDPPVCGRAPKPPADKKGRTLVTGSPAVVLAHGRQHSRLDSLREYWRSKDRSVGQAHLDAMRKKFKA